MWRKLVPRRSLLFAALVIASVRLGAGFIWTSNLGWKEPPEFGCGPSGTGGLCDGLERMAEHSMLEAHANVIEDVILPNYELFGYLIYLAESLTGVLLLLGLLTRLAAALGLLQSLNLFVGLSQAPDVWVWDYGLMMLLHLALLALAAGRYFGLDLFLHERWSHSRVRALAT